MSGGCGCRVELRLNEGVSQTGGEHDPDEEAAIVYCATHAAAFRLAELVHDLVEVSATAPTMSREGFAAAVLDPVLPRARALLQEIDGPPGEAAGRAVGLTGEALIERLAREAATRVVGRVWVKHATGEILIAECAAALRAALDEAAKVAREALEPEGCDLQRNECLSCNGAETIAAAIEALKEPAR